MLDDCDIDEETKSCLHDNICRRLTPQSVKIRAGKFQQHKKFFLTWFAGSNLFDHPNYNLCI